MTFPLGVNAAAALIDPPWSWKSWGVDGYTKSPQAHYACMSLEDIKALPIRECLAPDAYVILWATFPMLLQATDTLTAWGIRYVTGGAWAKQSSTGAKWAFGTGYILRSACEPFLIGKVGKPRPMSRSQRNLIVAPVREHSRKPSQMRELIENISPGPYIDIFSRGPKRDGWILWGDEIDTF